MKHIALNKKVLGLALVALAFGAISTTVEAAPKKKKATKKTFVEVSSVVTDESGQPLSNVAIYAGENASVIYTDEKGRFSSKVASDGVLVVEVFGYEDQVFRMSGVGSVPSNIKLVEEALFMTKESGVSRGDGGVTVKATEVGATSKMTGEKLESFSEYTVTNALQGKLLGLQVQAGVSGLGYNTPSIYVRGQHSNGTNEALVIVDGVERDLDDVLAEEIGTIEVLKDATAKILYGARAANGVLLVTTKRGQENRTTINLSAEMGVTQMTRTVDWLDSYQYATLYNEACVNDGITPQYSAADLEGYKNSAGANDMYYPNVDLADELLGNTGTYNKITFEMAGGSDVTRYAFTAGYVGGTGYEDVAYVPSLDRLSLRGNVDFKVADFITLRADAAARMEMRSFGQADSGSIYSAISTYRPNEFPLTLSQEATGLFPYDDNTPIFAGSDERKTNYYAEAMYGGYSKSRYMRAQSTLGIDFDLDMITDGLYAGGYISFDNYDLLETTLKKSYVTYEVDTYNDAAGNMMTNYNVLSEVDVNTDSSVSGSAISQNLSYNIFTGYDGVSGKHNYSARFNHNFAKALTKGASQDVINSNTSLRLNYLFDERFSVEGSLALMGSNRFSAGNKFFLSKAIGAAWILSNEEFLKDNDFVDFLKFKVSGGVLGYDKATSFMLFDDAWSTNGSLRFGTSNSGSTNYLVEYNKVPYDLEWESSTEMNVGIEALMLDRRLYVEANYFRELRENIINNSDASYGDYLGPFTHVDNVGTVFNQGVELGVSFSDRIGDFSYSIGVDAVWTKNEVREWNEVYHGEDYRYTVGYSTSTLTGLVANGLFGKDVELDGYYKQAYGACQDGDIAYADMNGDGYIDTSDRANIGNSYPRTTLGLQVDLNYKGWGLYLQGYSELGVDGFLSNNYYWNSGNTAYSDIVLDRWHATENPDGSYPRLTTTAGDNNFQNSTFWLQDLSFFKLKNVEVSYTFSRFNPSSPIKKVKVFARGTNLFVASKLKELDPEAVNAGVNNYPISRYITGGVSIDF